MCSQLNIHHFAISHIVIHFAMDDNSQSRNNDAVAEEHDSNLISKRELRCVPLKSALKCLVVQQISSYYQVAAVRALIKEHESEIWKVRQVFEEKLRNDLHIVGFFSCATALKQKIGEEYKEVPGISFWVMFDWPEYGLAAFENNLTKMFLSTGLSILSCKAVKGRGKCLNLYTSPYNTVFPVVIFFWKFV